MIKYAQWVLKVGRLVLFFGLAMVFSVSDHSKLSLLIPELVMSKESFE